MNKEQIANKCAELLGECYSLDKDGLFELVDEFIPKLSDYIETEIKKSEINILLKLITMKDADMVWHYINMLYKERTKPKE